MKKRKSKAAKKKCVCRKAPSLGNMKLSTLRTQANKIDKAIQKKVSHLGVSRRVHMSV